MFLGKGRFDNVISMGSRAMANTFPAIAQVDAYWEGLREGRLMPCRSEVDPRGLQGALEYAMLMEVVAPGIARVRVSGMHLNDLMGMEVRGMPITAFFDPADRQRLSDVLKEVVSGPKVAELTLSSPGGIGRSPLSAKLYIAPLSSERDNRPRLLACLQSKSGIGRTPRRFHIQEVHRRRIVAAAGAQKPNFDLDGVSGAAKTTPKSFAEEASDFARKPTRGSSQQDGAGPSKHPYLRLIKDADTQ